MNNKLLSIGSVVLLKEANKRVMIIGYYPTVISDENEITYDYSGCLFPEGVMDSQKAMLFNHSQIDKLFYYGLMDGEQNEFITRLAEVATEEMTNNDTSTAVPNPVDNATTNSINQLEFPPSKNG